MFLPESGRGRPPCWWSSGPGRWWAGSAHQWISPDRVRPRPSAAQPRERETWRLLSTTVLGIRIRMHPELFVSYPDPDKNAKTVINLKKNTLFSFKRESSWFILLFDWPGGIFLKFSPMFKITGVGSRMVQTLKKTRGRKSRWTVPLK